MRQDEQEVRFDLYCPTCEFKDMKMDLVPCTYCMDIPVREAINVPVKYKLNEKIKKKVVEK